MQYNKSYEIFCNTCHDMTIQIWRSSMGRAKENNGRFHDVILTSVKKGEKIVLFLAEYPFSIDYNFLSSGVSNMQFGCLTGNDF